MTEVKEWFAIFDHFQTKSVAAMEDYVRQWADGFVQKMDHSTFNSIVHELVVFIFGVTQYEATSSVLHWSMHDTSIFSDMYPRLVFHFVKRYAASQPDLVNVLLINVYASFSYMWSSSRCTMFRTMAAMCVFESKQADTPVRWTYKTVCVKLIRFFLIKKWDVCVNNEIGHLQELLVHLNIDGSNKFRFDV